MHKSLPFAITACVAVTAALILQAEDPTYSVLYADAIPHGMRVVTGTARGPQATDICSQLDCDQAAFDGIQIHGERVLHRDEEDDYFSVVAGAVLFRTNVDSATISTRVSSSFRNFEISWRDEPFAIAGKVAMVFTSPNITVIAVEHKDVAPARRLLADSKTHGTHRVAIICNGMPSTRLKGSNSHASNLFSGSLGRWRLTREHLRIKQPRTELQNSVSAEAMLRRNTTHSPPVRDRIDSHDYQADTAWLLSYNTEDASKTKTIAKLEEHFALDSSHVTTVNDADHLVDGGLILASGYRGFLEDCGCRTGKFGGLLRLSQAVERTRMTARIWAGDMLSWSDDSLFDTQMNAVFLHELQRSDWLAVAGATELMYFRHCQDVAASEWRHHFLLSNAHPREGFAAYRDIVVDGESYRVLGLFAPSLASCRRETASHLAVEYEWISLTETLDLHLRDWPSDRGVIVAGSYNPALVMPAISNLRRRSPPVLLASSSELLWLDTKGETVRHAGHWHDGTTRIIANTAHSYGVVQVSMGMQNASRVLLDDSVEPHGELFQQASAMLGKSQQAVDGPLAHLERPGQYIGSESCRSCHSSIYDQWSTTPHATAFETLERRRRAFAPQCVKCHVTAFGEPNGFNGELHLRNIGCEVCHGPGGSHAANPSQSPMENAVEAALCIQCHDAEHSAFDERAYMHQIRHSHADKKN